ncbi:MAG: protein adenylyltransferase SelO family protein [Myxococcaceae bacterium]|nr:protein adenylyltransferase SelO family protein [Myxococcaceae bacterium]
MQALLTPPRWDTLPSLGVGQTGQVLHAGRFVVKVALPGPEARARLREEAQLSALLRSHGVSTPKVLALRRDGRALVREYVEGQPLPAQLRGSRLAAVLRLVRAVRALEDELPLRFDLAPSNLLETAKGLVLLDAGRRVARSVLTADTPEGLATQWAAAHVPERATPVLRAFVPPPSGRFHVDAKVGTDPKVRLLWRNVGLETRLGVSWTTSQLESLGGLSTLAPAESTRPATRYVDMIALDRRRGPKGDGRAVLLGTLNGRELSLKGCGPTPLAWKGRQFHEDGFVSFPRALWEVTAGDELARLGFDVPEALAVFSTGHTTLDNTGRRWPAAATIRVASTHWRLGHLRAWTHRPEQLRVVLDHVGRTLVGPDFTHSRPTHVQQLVAQFAANLGHDIGRTDAMQIHGFNPTPGNVRLDGHLIDFSTVRFFSEYLPDWRFLENTYAVRLHRLVWRRLVTMLVGVLHEGGVRGANLAPALRRFDRAYVDGFAKGLEPFFGSTRGSASERRRFVQLTIALRALRRSGTSTYRYWKQSVPAPRFDLLGKADLVVRALERGHRAPWQVALVVDEPLSPRDLRLAERWVEALRSVRDPGAVARSWPQVVRPFVEPEALAALLYGASTPRDFRTWQQRISTSRHLPEGRHSTPRARRLATRLGHVELPSLDGARRERVIGLTPELLEGVRDALRRLLGKKLVGCVAHGSRVMDRATLARVAPGQLRGNDLRVRQGEGVREFGPVPGASSDLDLKVFVSGLGGRRGEELERKLGATLAALGAWFPFSGHVPPRQRLIETDFTDVVQAFRRWNGTERKRTLGKGPIPERQVVIIC